MESIRKVICGTCCLASRSIPSTASTNFCHGISLQIVPKANIRSRNFMDKPRGRVYLDPMNRQFTIGTFKDLEEEKISPAEGMTLHFWHDDANDAGKQDNLIFEGVIHFDKTLGRWYAVIDEHSYRHESDEQPSR